MKGLVGVTLAASLALGVAAGRHEHQHRYRHVKRYNGSPVEKRNVVTVTETAQGGVATVYDLEGEFIPEDEAMEGIEAGMYVIIGSSTPTTTSSPSVESTTEPTTSAEATLAGAGFLENQEETPTTTTTTTAPPESTEESEESEESGDGGSGGSSGEGIDSDFPDGELPCSSFPSSYGAMALPHLNQHGWSGIQRTPNYILGDVSIDYIETGIDGDDCIEDSFCSYACPPGYEKSQWPSAQGATLQSIGGLLCLNGKLHLSRPEKKRLCEPGVGGVVVKNSLSEVVSTCRTDYPGHEGMVIPIISEPGSTYPLTNPDSVTYYRWDNKPTTAQYYINKKGYGLEDACVWNSPRDPMGAGNWAPLNLGTGRDDKGVTYLSIFYNRPTTTADLDFKVRITGDVSIKCEYKNGQFYPKIPGQGELNGCTTAILEGGTAIVEYFD